MNTSFRLVNTGVILIASGYMFVCPECDKVGYLRSATSIQVTCEGCLTEFPVVEVRHRTNDIGLTPGVSPGELFIPQELETDQPSPAKTNSNGHKKGRKGGR